MKKKKSTEKDHPRRDRCEPLLTWDRRIGCQRSQGKKNEAQTSRKY